jgi:outer membrane protein
MFEYCRVTLSWTLWILLGSSTLLSNTSHASGPTASVTPQAIGFEAAYKEIIQRSLRVETQALRLSIARERKLARWGAFTPSVSLQGTNTQEGGQYQSTFASPGATQTSLNGAAIVANMNLFRSGGDAALVTAASHDIGNERETLQRERQGAEDDAVQALVDVIARVSQTQITFQIVKLKDQSLTIARERFDRGLLPAQEVDKVEIELENSRSKWIDAKTAEAEARSRLKSLLGSDSIEIQWPWKDAVVKGPQLDTVEFKLSNRPDYRAATEASEAERWRKRSAYSSFLPSLDLQASYGTVDLSNTPRRDWSAIFTLTIPLFDRFKSWSDLKIQEMTQMTQEIVRESIVRSAPGEIDSFRESFRSARESALNRERTSRLTERLYKDNLQRFRLGRASANDLALDQNRLLDSQFLEVEGWLTAHVSIMKLCHALGGSISVDGSCHSDVPERP